MWELQRHMIGYLAPSIELAIIEDASAFEDLFEEHHLKGFTADAQARILAEVAETFSSTTIGGHEFYIDNYTTIPFCSEDDMLEYYG